MSVVETVLAFVVPPVAILGVLLLLTVGRKAGRKPRYRSGEGWDFDPVLWTANPEGAHLPAPTEHVEQAATTGGARGHW
ncbi:aa3-type cytochrome oxidase subunit CtaJ [Pseudonocardia pini]|uniref:aa3-type cytochrome oxidase subunit CtaJ n=1 Tax=Pseudonocardia pini TaxID=2758030 RepID=UPI0015F05DCA|nr:hypothetical protein [Pseudonocardia pini]